MGQNEPERVQYVDETGEERSLVKAVLFAVLCPLVILLSLPFVYVSEQKSWPDHGCIPVRTSVVSAHCK